MIGLPPRPKPGRAAQIFGLLGIWVGLAAFFPTLPWLALSVSPRRPLSLPAWGSPAFWGLVGVDVLMASLATLSGWIRRNRPVVRRTGWGIGVPRRRPAVVTYGITLGFALLPPLIILLGNPGGAIHWRSLLGALAVQAASVWLATRGSALALPPPVEVPALAWSPPPPTPWSSLSASSSPSTPAASWPPLPTTVWPPSPVAQTGFVLTNPRRAWVSEAAAVYSRPRSAQTTMLAFSLIPLWLLGSCALFIPLVLYSSGPHRGVLVGFFGLGGLMGLGMLLVMLSGVGPEELHVRRQERTYRLRSGAEWGPAFLPGGLGPMRLTLPWRVVERFGTADEFAGVGMLVRVLANRSGYASSVFYSVVLRWADPTRPPIHLGSARDEAQARVLQAQAAEDLGVPVV